MKDDKEKHELGSIVTATRTFNRETITGEFGGFHLLDKSNPKSIVGVVHTPNGSYDVEPYSIESVISEDERIRKSIIDMVKKQMPKSENKKWMLAWLEKQGKREHVVVIPRFRVGDVIRPKGSMAEYTIESISGGCYYGKGWGLDISCDDDYELVEQKPAWSEEDEKLIEEVAYSLRKYSNYVQGGNSKLYILSLADSIESLQPQNTWRPSDEQMDALNLAIGEANSVDTAAGDEAAEILTSLYEQLKKLKEE